MPDHSIVTDPKKIKSTVTAMTKAGRERLHILADFDRTLTKAFVNGRRVPSLISVLRDHNFLTPAYPAAARALYKRYHTVELDPKIPLIKKKKAMHQWWTEHFQLLIKSGLAKKDIKRAMTAGKIKLRPGAKQFLRLLNKNNIPLVIMSSSGLGYESISTFLKHHRLLTKNIYIISNAFVWDRHGRILGVKQPIIHSLNKDATVLKNFPFYKKISNRKNVILLGDSPGDVGMVSGFACQQLLKIGFLNEVGRENLNLYKKHFDVIILNDGTLNYLNQTLKKIIYN